MTWDRMEYMNGLLNAGLAYGTSAKENKDVSTSSPMSSRSGRRAILPHLDTIDLAWMQQ